MVNTAFHFGDPIAVVHSTETGAFLAELPPPLRLAVVYAPARVRGAWAALLLLDHRLSRAVAGASEPLLAQVKLAWWRDRMRTPASQWPQGEPLLAALARFDGERPALEALVDAWEGLIDGEAAVNETDRLAQARAGAVAALARISDCPVNGGAIEVLARRWTVPDAAQAETVRLPRALRPLVILANLPRSSDAGPLAMLRIVRLGLFGR